MAGGTEVFDESGYGLTFTPDLNNDALQRAGKPPVYYWMPRTVRLAQVDSAAGAPYLFSMVKFAGVPEGADGQREGMVAGGVLTFTVTGAPPAGVLERLQAKLIAKFNGGGDFFWGIRTGKSPYFRPAIVVSNTTSVSNLSPIPTGDGLPTVDAGPGGTRRFGTGFRVTGMLAPPPDGAVRGGRDAPANSNLNPWYWNMQGEGPGSIDPGGTNAFSALIGQYPAEIAWQAFHGVASPLIVIQNLKHKVWSPVVELSIRGKWKKIFEHFSAAFEAHYLFASVDIKAELNKLRTNGDIEVDIKIDETLPNADKIRESIDKRSDLVFEKFMEEAKKMIFEPPPPSVEPASASGGSGPWGVGLALKYRRDETNLELNYHEKRQFAYLQETTISGSLSGVGEAIAADPTAEKKYFQIAYLDEWPRAVARVVAPVVNWPDPSRNWIGEPVAFLSAQVGYPDTQGAVQWSGHMFQPGADSKSAWKFAQTQKRLQDVAQPPAGWQPDMTYVKRKVHLLEPPSESANPYVRIQIDQNTIELDPEPLGTLLNDVNLEVRADSAGRLNVGPISLGVVLEEPSQLVEVTMEATDGKDAPTGRPAVKFLWKQQDQDEARYWTIYTGDPELRAFFRYRVRVVIKGTLLRRGQEWEGPWEVSSGNGPITLRVPLPDDAGVVTRELPSALAQVRTGPPAIASREAPPVTPPEPAIAAPPNGSSVSGSWTVTTP